MNFPHLPAGCSIQLDRVAREYVLNNIKENLLRLHVQIPERLQTFVKETGQPLTFGNFVRYHEYEPEMLLTRETWTQWKARAQLEPKPQDPDLACLKSALIRMASMNSTREIRRMQRVIRHLLQHDRKAALQEAAEACIPIHYRFWGKPGQNLDIENRDQSFARLMDNPSVLHDVEEILDWAEDISRISGTIPELSFPCPLELHARYSNIDILANLGIANLESAGQRGVGVIHFRQAKAYILLITYQKTEREFSPSTMYADYPISRELLHWESQSNTTQDSNTGRNLIHHTERGYTILIFARNTKKRNNVTLPYTYLGPAKMLSYENERPIKMVWRLQYQMPAEMFEENRRGG